MNQTMTTATEMQAALAAAAHALSHHDKLISALRMLVHGATNVIGQDSCGQDMVKVRKAAIEKARVVLILAENAP